MYRNLLTIRQVGTMAGAYLVNLFRQRFILPMIGVVGLYLACSTIFTTMSMQSSIRQAALTNSLAVDDTGYEETAVKPPQQQQQQQQQQQLMPLPVRAIGVTGQQDLQHRNYKKEQRQRELVQHDSNGDTHVHVRGPHGSVRHRYRLMEHRSIPKIIHQTWKTAKLPGHLQHSANSWQQLNPGYTYKLHTDADIEALIHNSHPELVPLYNRLSPVMRADLFRYLILFHEGGYYADVDVDCKQPIDTWLERSHNYFNVGIMIGFEVVTGRADWAQWFARQYQMCQWAMASIPGHAILGRTIDHIVAQFENKTDAQVAAISAVKLTGPAVWTDAVTDFLLDEFNVTFGTKPFTKTYLADNFVHIGDVLLLPLRSFSVGSGGYSPKPGMATEDEFIRHGFLGSWKKGRHNRLNSIIDASADEWRRESSATGGFMGDDRSSFCVSARGGAEVCVSSNDSPADEGWEKALDGSAETKWLTFIRNGLSRERPTWLTVRPRGPKKGDEHGADQAVSMPEYTIVSGNDGKSRDPRDWDVEGGFEGDSSDGDKGAAGRVNWTLIHEVRNHTWLPEARKTPSKFSLTPQNASLAFSIFRWSFYAVRRDTSDSLQFAELEVPAFELGAPQKEQ